MISVRSSGQGTWPPQDMYHEPDEWCYLTDAGNDILESEPSYAGRIGYICEYDS